MDSLTVLHTDRAFEVWGDHKTIIKNSTMRDAGHGIWVHDANRSSRMHNNTFDQITSYPVHIETFDLDSTLYANTYTNIDSNNSYIYINTGGVNRHYEPGSTYDWTKDNLPYRVDDHLAIHEQKGNNNNPSVLRIEEGTVVQFPEGKILHIGHNNNDVDRTGKLEAKGVIFTLADNQTDKWGGIKFWNGADKSSSILNSTIEKTYQGIYIYDGLRSPDIQGSRCYSIELAIWRY